MIAFAVCLVTAMILAVFCMAAGSVFHERFERRATGAKWTPMAAGFIIGAAIFVTGFIARGVV